MILYEKGNLSQAGYPPFGREIPPDKRKEGDKMITYSEMIQFCIFVVALVSLCYQIFKNTKK